MGLSSVGPPPLISIERDPSRRDHFRRTRRRDDLSRGAGDPFSSCGASSAQKPLAPRSALSIQPQKRDSSKISFRGIRDLTPRIDAQERSGRSLRKWSIFAGCRKRLRLWVDAACDEQFFSPQAGCTNLALATATARWLNLDRSAQTPMSDRSQVCFVQQPEKDVSVSLGIGSDATETNALTSNTDVRIISMG